MSLLHRLAVLGVEEAVLGRSDERSAAIGKIVDALPERLEENSGAFVTLWRGGQLRGCIGEEARFEVFTSTEYAAPYSTLGVGTKPDALGDGQQRPFPDRSVDMPLLDRAETGSGGQKTRGLSGVELPRTRAPSDSYR